jgi:flagellar motor switch protein FliM
MQGDVENRSSLSRLLARRSHAFGSHAFKEFGAKLAAASSRAVAAMFEIDVDLAFVGASHEGGSDATPEGTIIVTSPTSQGQGSGAVIFENRFFFGLLDAVYGGGGKSPQLPDRPLTSLEWSLAEQIVTSIMARVPEALGYGPDLGSGAALEKPAGSGLAAGRGSVASIRLELYSDALIGRLWISIPASHLAVLLDAGAATGRTERGEHVEHSKRLKETVESLRLPVSAAVAGPMVSIGDIVRLGRGSMIEIDRSVLSGLTLECGGVRVFDGRLGQSKGAFTVCVTQPAGGPDREEWQG